MNDQNKAELRRLANEATETEMEWPDATVFGRLITEDWADYAAAASPAAILSLLDELDRSNAMCAKHGKALQEIGSALSLGAGADLHRECVPAIYGLFRSIGSGVTEAYKERMRCQEVIDQLRAEVEALRKDAERYRFLRDCEDFFIRYTDGEDIHLIEDPDRLDAVVDVGLLNEGSANG